MSNSILLYNPGKEVLSILIFEQFENGQLFAALVVVMVLTLVVLVAIAYKLGAKVGLKSE